jgi:hypothetical protein
VTALLLIGVSPVGVKGVADYHRLPGSPGAVVTLILIVAVLFVLAGITLLKGKIWTSLLGVFVPLLFIVGAFRLGRPESPWAHWRYTGRPAKLARALRREQRLRQPVVHAKIRIQDLLAGRPDQPDPASRPTAIGWSARPTRGHAITPGRAVTAGQAARPGQSREDGR